MAARLVIDPAVTTVGEQPVMLHVENIGDTRVLTGSAYSLECWDGSKWQRLPPGVFFSYARVLEPGSSSDPKPVWHTAGDAAGLPKEPLPPGTYRVTKSVMPEPGRLEDKVSLSVYLTVRP